MRIRPAFSRAIGGDARKKPALRIFLYTTEHAPSALPRPRGSSVEAPTMSGFPTIESGKSSGEQRGHRRCRTALPINSKFQAPNSKQAPSTKFRKADRCSGLGFGAWSLFGAWHLVFGISGQSRAGRHGTSQNVT